jgi:hypothetical protein
MNGIGSHVFLSAFLGSMRLKSTRYDFHSSSCCFIIYRNVKIISNYSGLGNDLLPVD